MTKEEKKILRELYISANASQRVILEKICPKLKESEDERIRKELLESFKYQQRESRTDKEWLNGIKLSEVVAWLEKQREKRPDKNIVEIWKDMRSEVYQQASGNRHEPNYSDDSTKMFSLNDIDEIIEKMSEQNNK